jgi:uncharacterized protein YrrD
VDNFGPLVAYLRVPVGVPVYDQSGASVGTVEHVLADEGADIFHGLLIRTNSGHLFAAREQINEMYEGGVTLAVDAADLHEPSEDAPAAEATPGSTTDQAKEGLRRAWQWLSQPRG